MQHGESGHRASHLDTERCAVFLAKGRIGLWVLLYVIPQQKYPPGSSQSRPWALPLPPSVPLCTGSKRPNVARGFARSSTTSPATARLLAVPPNSATSVYDTGGALQVRRCVRSLTVRLRCQWWGNTASTAILPAIPLWPALCCCGKCDHQRHAGRPSPMNLGISHRSDLISR